jgi:ketosteroid isomerase-like protein
LTSRFAANSSLVFDLEEYLNLNEKTSRRIRIESAIAAPISILALVAVLSLAALSSRSAAAPPQSDDAAAILTLLNDQTAAWNRGDVEGFMNGYWNSDQTEFVSADGVSRGWRALLERYRRSYPDRKAMGHLTFSGLEVRVDCPTAAYAVGEFHLQRENDNPSGVFTLDFRKFPEGWRIVVDHTTAFAKPVAASNSTNQ